MLFDKNNEVVHPRHTYEGKKTVTIYEISKSYADIPVSCDYLEYYNAYREHVASFDAALKKDVTFEYTILEVKPVEWFTKNSNLIESYSRQYVAATDDVKELLIEPAISNIKEDLRKSEESLYNSEKELDKLTNHIVELPLMKRLVYAFTGVLLK
jgi:hypothetical protein